MSDGTYIVQNAFGKLGAHSEASPATSEDIDKGFRLLHSILQQLESESVNLGTNPVIVPGDEVNEPPDVTELLGDMLALRAAPFFDNGRSVVSNELRYNATRAEMTIKNLYGELEIPKKKVSPTLPRGQGAQGHLRYSRVYHGEDSEIE